MSPKKCRKLLPLLAFLYLFISSSSVGVAQNAAAAAKANLPHDGTPIKIKPGQGAATDSTDLESMLLLMTNASSGLAGAQVSFSIFSSNVVLDTLTPGIPGPNMVIDNWNGKRLSISNISNTPFALLQLRLYSRFSTANLPLKNGQNNKLAQYKSIGDTLSSGPYQLTISASVNTTRFVLLLPDDYLTIEVNSTQSVKTDHVIQISSNQYSHIFTLKENQPILIINTSRSPAARGSVKLVNLGN